MLTLLSASESDTSQAHSTQETMLEMAGRHVETGGLELGGGTRGGGVVGEGTLIASVAQQGVLSDVLLFPLQYLTLLRAS